MTKEMALKIVKMDSPEITASRIVELYNVIDELTEKQTWIKYPENKPDPRKIRSEDSRILVKIKWPSGKISNETILSDLLSKIDRIIAFQYIDPYIPEE